MAFFPSCLIVGDLHGDVDALLSFLEKNPVSLLLQAGDFGFVLNAPEIEKYSLLYFEKRLSELPLPPQLFFCEGNHEDWPALSSLKEQASLEQLEKGIRLTPHITWMPRGSRLTLFDGRVVLFLGGAKSVDWRLSMIFKKESPFLDREMELLKMSDLPETVFTDPYNIAISHTAPASFLFPGIDDLTKYQIRDKERITGWDLSEDKSRLVLDEVLKANPPQQWFCGHFHMSFSGTHKINEKDVTVTVLDCSAKKILE